MSVIVIWKFKSNDVSHELKFKDMNAYFEWLYNKKPEDIEVLRVSEEV